MARMETEGLWGYNPHQALLEGLQSPLTFICPRGYNPLGQSLESAWIIFTINNVSLWPEGDRWEHFNPTNTHKVCSPYTNNPTPTTAVIM